MNRHTRIAPADDSTRLYNTRYPLFDPKLYEPECEDFQALPGVQRARIDRYSVEITKAALFSWDEVEPAVLSLLKTFEHLEEVKPDA